MDGSVHQSQNHIQVGHVNPSFIRGRCRRTGTQLLQHGAKMSVTFLVVGRFITWTINHLLMDGFS